MALLFAAVLPSIPQVQRSADAEDKHAAVFIIAENQPGVLAQVAAELAQQQININEITSKSLVDGRTELHLTIQVRNASQLYAIIELIRKLPHILEVVRDTDE